MRIKASVLMAARNAEDTVEEAVRSVLAQRGVSFELLIGEDASTDGTWERIRPFCRDPRVRGFRFRSRCGPSAVRNRLIARARGTYLSILDADDRMLPGNLRRLCRVLDRCPGAGVAYGRSVVTGPGKRVLADRIARGENTRLAGWDLLGRPFHHSGSLLRKSFVRKLRGYDPRLAFGEDSDLFLRLAEIGSFKSLNGKPTVAVRRRPGSFSDRDPRTVRQRARAILRAAIRRRYGMLVPW